MKIRHIKDPFQRGFVRLMVKINRSLRRQGNPAKIEDIRIYSFPFDSADFDQ